MPKPVEIKGVKETLRKLEQIGGKAAVRANRRAVNVSTTLILKATKASCPREHGDLRKALVKKVYNKQMTAGGVIGADNNYVVAGDPAAGGFKVDDTSKTALKSLRDAGVDLTRPAKYDHLVEYGHAVHGGGTVPPHPFLRPGWDSSINAAQKKYETELVAGIEKEAAKGT